MAIIGISRRRGLDVPRRGGSGLAPAGTVICDGCGWAPLPLRAWLRGAGWHPGLLRLRWRLTLLRYRLRTLRDWLRRLYRAMLHRRLRRVEIRVRARPVDGGGDGLIVVVHWKVLHIGSIHTRIDWSILAQNSGA
ncbi:MAG: hypothetical protein IPK52_04320 [Chloroflexi bacterium]|nr:hypothetical protein [Chloroflexota bacterium]